ncbi:MAG: SprT-like domain-containing protein [Deltaproteobacteria bacterium]|jgi:hypothetical protein|nr:SprT-like domain-containing protein [Deltaproteobacteria bacterium]
MTRPNAKREILKTDLKNAWIKAVLKQHRFLVSKLGLEKRLQERLDSFIVLFESDSAWGYYHAQEEKIGLNLRLFENCPWVTIVGVLGHEIAHQASHLLAPAAFATENPHGATFQSFFKRLDLDPIFGRPAIDEEMFRFPPNPFAPHEELDPDPILAKVQKLLALATSPAPAEAESALAAASRLMAKHNIDLAQSQNPVYERWILPLGVKRTSSRTVLIASILKKYFFVEAIYIYQYDPLKNDTFQALEMIGRPVNLIMANHVYHFLNERVETLWSHHKPLAKEAGETGLGAKNAFINSLLSSFARKLNKTQSSDQSGDLPSSQLILAADKGLRDYLRHHYPDLVSASYRYRNAVSPYSQKAGAQEGQDLSIYPPVGERRGGFGGLLED